MTNKSEKEININTEEQEEALNENHIEDTIYLDFEREELIELLINKDSNLKTLEDEINALKDTVLRKAAELDNYRKRVQRERSQIYSSAKASALEDFLSISDDLTRTLQASKETEVPQSFLDGINLLADKFDEVLKRHNVERIDQEMVPFNVDLHDAMMRQKPEDDSIESDMVLKVIENGYKIEDRVVRHAKVIVSE